MYDYTQKITTAEMLELSSEEKAEYIANRKAYRRWETKMLKEQTVMGAIMIASNLLALTGAAVALVPLGIWMIWCAAHKNIVIC